MSRPRWSKIYTERCIVNLLREHPTGRISFDKMAAELRCDRRTLISAMARLRYAGQVRVVELGRGNRPHCYQVSA